MLANNNGKYITSMMGKDQTTPSQTGLPTQDSSSKVTSMSNGSDSTQTGDNSANKDRPWQELPQDSKIPATNVLPAEQPESGASSGDSGASQDSGDFGRLTGYSYDKYNANKQDAKYQMAHVLSQFDPTKGVTPEVLAALNKLGYGTFSGSGDKLNLSGLTDAGRKMGLTGDYQGADFIQGFKGGNGKWAYQDPFAEAQQGGGSSASPTSSNQPGGLPDSLSQYYGLPPETGGITTNVSDQLKDLLSRYYSGSNGGGMSLKFGSGSSGQE